MLRGALVATYAIGMLVSAKGFASIVIGNVCAVSSRGVFAAAMVEWQDENSCDRAFQILESRLRVAGIPQVSPSANICMQSEFVTDEMNKVFVSCDTDMEKNHTHVFSGMGSEPVREAISFVEQSPASRQYHFKNCRLSVVQTSLTRNMSPKFAYCAYGDATGNWVMQIGNIGDSREQVCDVAKSRIGGDQQITVRSTGLISAENNGSLVRYECNDSDGARFITTPQQLLQFAQEIKSNGSGYCIFKSNYLDRTNSLPSR